MKYVVLFSLQAIQTKDSQCIWKESCTQDTLRFARSCRTLKISGLLTKSPEEDRGIGQDPDPGLQELDVEIVADVILIKKRKWRKKLSLVLKDMEVVEMSAIFLQSNLQTKPLSVTQVGVVHLLLWTTPVWEKNGDTTSVSLTPLDEKRRKMLKGLQESLEATDHLEASTGLVVTSREEVETSGVVTIEEASVIITEKEALEVEDELNN